MKLTTTALILALTAAPAFAGGPVVTEEPEVTAPARDNGWIVPVLLLVGIAIIASSGGGDEPQSEGPKPCVKTGGGCG